jgi:HSP20 family protein
MAIERWDPFRDAVRLRDDLNRWWPFEGEARKIVPWSPDIDIKETEKEITFKADLPGMKMEDIDVSVDDSQVTISGERKFEKEEKGKDFVRTERSYGSFCRSFNTGVPIKEDKVKADYKDGVLNVVLPKAEARKPKKIKVSGGK